MINKLSDFKKFIKGKRVAVLGVGISNKPLIKYLYNLEAKITAFDMSDENNENILQTKNEFADSKIDIDWSLGKNYLKFLHGFDIIFKTPKIRPDIKELISERKMGAIITSEMEVFLQFCPCETVGITGSDGKTTTTTIVSKLLEKEGYSVHTGGNIGKPLLSEIDSIKEEDIVVLELSSFQLQTIMTSPDRALITNISPNHLDVHNNYNEYIRAKTNIFLHQNLLGKLFINNEDKKSKTFIKNARGTVIYFLGNNSYSFYDKDYIYRKKDKNKYTKFPIEDILIKGEHNYKNYCAAISVVGDLISDKTIANVMNSFNGVEHRLELVKELNGIKFYNSSIDSSPTRTKATLKAFEDFGQEVVLITGGKDKNSDYSGLGKQILKVSKNIILCGENSKMIEQDILFALKENKEYNVPYIYEAKDYDDAIRKAYKIANKGIAVVLSPAGTSFDRFKNFEQRGDEFKRIVNNLS